MLKNINIKKAAYLLLLLLFPPMTIELLSGSTPPQLYFNPITILFFTIAYGLPYVLIREAKIRWDLDWSFVFLVPIIGIYIEGIFMQSFFNTAHEDLGILSDFGVYYGVQWPWAIYLIIMHGIFALIIPMFMIDILFPTFKQVTLLSKKRVIISAVLIILLTLLQFFNINAGDQAMFALYEVDIFKTILCFILIMLLTGLSYIFRNSKLHKTVFFPKKRHHTYGFIYMILLLLATYFFAEIHVILTLITQLILTVVLMVFLIHFVYQTTRTTEDMLPLYNGTMLYFALMALLQESGFIENLDSPYGMSNVGVFFIMLSIIINIVVLRRKKKPII